MASFVASFKVLLPDIAGTTVLQAFSFARHLALDVQYQFLPYTQYILMPIKAQTVAVATPCCPAPVSAMIRVLPNRLAIIFDQWYY